MPSPGLFTTRVFAYAFKEATRVTQPPDMISDKGTEICHPFAMTFSFGVELLNMRFRKTKDHKVVNLHKKLSEERQPSAE